MKLLQNEGQREQAYVATSLEVPRWKRVMDMALVLITLPLLLLLMALVALVIWMVSAGPVVFKQERVGFLGRRFMCFKFRTMYADADTKVHQGHLVHLIQSNLPMVKMDDQGDQRIIPFGSFFRSSGLDELPQILNVLWGEMSLVGPRPCLPYEYESYRSWQRERFETLPGLTGLWQVNGKNRTTFVQMIQMDIDYVRNKTLWLDTRIILKTIPALVGQMRDARRKKRASVRTVPAKTIPASRNLNQPSLPETAFSDMASPDRKVA